MNIKNEMITIDQALNPPSGFEVSRWKAFFLIRGW